LAGKLNLLNCADECLHCVKKYKKKHDLKPGDQFQISCEGIPKNYIAPGLSAIMSDEDKAIFSMLDPVSWAATTLDWHCEDPVGEIWKRKTEEGTLGTVTPYIEELHSEKVLEGKSAYHRPYQKEALQCSSRRRVMRWGRQLGKSEVLVVAVLFAACTHKNFNVIIVTPYQVQIDMIFKRLETMIKSSKPISNSIKRNVKAPNYKIELHNGSQISGFTAGTKSGGNADAVRGQAAQMLVLDEMDYLGSQDVASVLSVITNYPNATVWISSTPTGKREKFYEICHSPLYKEIHHPSMMNPLWDEDLEAFFRGEFTSIQYEHEVLASFGEQEQGVYQNSYVTEAMDDYKYSDMKPSTDWIYAIGVDWNDVRIGTTICVTGYNPLQNEFRIFTREVVSREGWTQHAACQRIIDLNRLWKPRSIYVDFGFGGTQFEILKKVGWDAISDPQRGKTHPDSKLREIVKQYDFGSKVTIKDLFTKQDIDKAAKPFLVENSVRRFEQKTIKFSKYDIQMEKELRGYVVDHITSIGTPVYKQGNEKVGDHNLDALNLSLVAFTLEMSAFGVVVYDNTIAFSGNIGEHTDKVLIGSPQPQQKINSKPSLQRTNVFSPNFSSKNPSHNGREGGPQIWSWPGFDRDVPRSSSNIRTNLRRTGPPSRKKF
jgi:hypothetical protein